MTCLAFDGQFLAADRGIFSGGFSHPQTKVFRVDGHRGKMVIALCGYWSLATVVKAYFESKEQVDFPDCTKFETDCADAIGMVVTDDMACRTLYGNGMVSDPIEYHWAAQGAGLEFLSGAMAMGATAERAIQLAMVHTRWAAQGVDVVDCLAYFGAK